ncbi:MAG TPA: DapH/DapD/GlmU-related protein [Thiobacillus sp.]
MANTLPTQQQMSRKKLIIYGNGQMARMFLHFARLEYEVAALTVDQAVLADTVIQGVPVVPFEDVEMAFSPASHCLITAVGYREMNDLRARKYQEGKAKGYTFATFVHESVVLHSDVSIGENSIVLDHVAIHPGTHIGRSVFVSSNASIGHGCRIDDNCWINSGVSIGGETRIGEASFLGINASISDNIQIERRCFVGANTLVTRNTGIDEVYVSASGERFPLSSQAFLQFIARSTR